MRREAESVPGLEQIADAIRFIEERLARPLRIEDVALVARYSPYHFLRVFHALAGETPGDYIRRRRLTCAARELTGGSRRVLEIALDWGFDSQAAFSRAFKRQFLVPPGAYRRAGRNRLDRERAAWTPGAFAHVGSGGITRSPRLEILEGAVIMGFEAAVNFSGDSGGQRAAHRAIYELWERYFAHRRELAAWLDACGAAVADREQFDRNVYYELGRLESASSQDVAVTPDSRFIKLVGQALVPGVVESMRSSPGPLPAGMILRRLPSRRYAVFTHTGPVEQIQASCDFIYGVWARDCDLRLAAGDEVQVFDRQRFSGQGDRPGSFEIRVPVKSSRNVPGQTAT